MQLTDEQAEAARALGCRFIPATEAQVRQFSMQRRVFTLGGAPFLAARQDGFYETAGTLLALIAEAMKTREAALAAPPAAAPPEPEPAPEPEAPEAAPLPEAPVPMATAPAPEAPDDELPEPMVSPAPRPVPIDFPLATAVPPPGGTTAPVMAATVTIVRGYARRGTLDTGGLTALVTTVHQALQRLR